MKVLRLHNKGNLKLHDEPDPVATADEYLLRISAVGICGSDIQWLKKGNIGDARLVRPLVLGHECAGIIEDMAQGSGRVAVDPAICCSTCEFCREGNANLCENMQFAGHDGLDGTLCEKRCWPKAFIHRLPDDMSAIEGAMLEPLGVALHAMDLGHLRLGMTVGVFGCGPIGLLLIQLARAAGAERIIATDRLKHRLEAAREFGATTCITAEDASEWAEVWDATGKKGVDIAFEAACDGSATETAVRSIRPGRHLVLLGIPDDDRIVFTASIARRKALTIRLVRRMKHTYPRAIDLVHNQKIDVHSLVTHRFSLDDFERAFHVAQKREGLKVIVEP